MKKMRIALIALACSTGALTACGESPMGPSRDVPLMGAEAKGSKGSTATTTSTTTEENSTKTTTKKGHRRTMSGGYILGMD